MKLFAEAQKLNLNSPLAEIAQIIFDSTYLQPFLGKSKEEFGENTIERVSHGAQHASRVAAFIPLFVDIYRAMGNQEALELTDREIKILQIVALFHDAARQNDRLADKWEKDSAELCQKFLEQMGLTTEEASKYSSLILKKEKGGLLGRIFQSADCIDIIRCKSVFAIERMSCYQDADAAWRDTIVKNIVPAAVELIGAQSDLRNDISIQLNNQELFTKKKTRNFELKAKKYEHAKNVYSAVATDFENYPMLTDTYWSSHNPQFQEKIESNQTNLIKELHQSVAGYEDFYFQLFLKATHFFLTKKLNWQQAQTIFSKEFPAQWEKRGFILRSFSPDLLCTSQNKEWLYYIYQDKQSALTHLCLFKLLLAEQHLDFVVHGKVSENKQHSETPYRIQLNKQQHKTLQDLRLTDSLIKSLRWDVNCFIEKFILSITKSPINQFHEPLRWKRNHNKYTVFASGVYLYDERPSPYPSHRLEEKKFLSQAQSTSMISIDLQIPVFGHLKARADKLVGCIFDINDALINRYSIYDGGTISRPYETNDKVAAEKYYKEKVCGSNPILFDNVDAFKQAAKKDITKINELLARIKWNINTSSVGIFNDTFSSRCIAQAYAHLIHERIKIQYQEMGLHLRDDYEVPIHFYLPGQDNNLMRYTTFQQEQDKNEADKIMSNPVKIKEMFQKNNFEFLLIQRKPDQVLSSNYNNLPILLHLINFGLFAFAKILFSRTKLAKTVSFESYIQEIAKKYNNEFKTAAFDSINDNNDKPLHLAARQNYAKLLHIWEKNLNVKNKYGWTALHTASRYGSTNVVKSLLELGCDVDLKTHDDSTALHKAANHGFLDVVKLLLQKSKYTNPRNTKDWTPLHKATKSGHVDIVKELIENGANCNLVTKTKVTALQIAAILGHYKIVELLIDKGSNLSALNDNGFTAFHYAAKNGYLDIVKLLINKGFDLNSKSSDGSTALFLAAQNNHLKVAKYLLEKGADIGCQNNNGLTALHTAALNGNCEIVKLLIEKNINMSIKTHKDSSPLKLAAINGHHQVAILLLERYVLYKHEAFDSKACKIALTDVKEYLLVDPNNPRAHFVCYVLRRLLQDEDCYESLVQAAKFGDQQALDKLRSCPDRKALYELGMMYLNGIGVIKDSNYAEKYFTLSGTDEAKLQLIKMDIYNAHEEPLTQLKTLLLSKSLSLIAKSEVLKHIERFTKFDPYRARALLLLAQAYHHGVATDINFKKAADYYSKYHQVMPKDISSLLPAINDQEIFNCLDSTLIKMILEQILGQEKPFSLDYKMIVGVMLKTKEWKLDYLLLAYSELNTFLNDHDIVKLLNTNKSQFQTDSLAKIITNFICERQSPTLFLKWVGDNTDVLQKIMTNITLLSQLTPMSEWSEFLQKYKIQKIIKTSSLSNGKNFTSLFFPHEYFTNYVNETHLIKNAQDIYLEKKMKVLLSINDKKEEYSKEPTKYQFFAQKNDELNQVTNMPELDKLIEKLADEDDKKYWQSL